MFNDRYGLTAAVLQGRKTMTRRICKEYATGQLILASDVESFRYYPDENIVEFLMSDGTTKVSVPPYKNNEVVAVAQNYNDAAKEAEFNTHDEALSLILLGKQREKGWTNKLFVKPNLMPYQIQITDINIERLQDITDKDCIKEGIYVNPNPPKWREYDPYEPWPPYVKPYKFTTIKGFCKPQFAFAYLIDAVSGKGTWEENPFVFAYSFKLIK